MIENIKNLYSKIERKTEFIKMVADDLGLNPQYVRGHYFSAFWSIPEERRGRIVELLQNTIREQEWIEYGDVDDLDAKDTKTKI